MSGPTDGSTDGSTSGSTSGSAGRCAEHEQVPDELRLLVLALLDRVEPGLRSLLRGIRERAEQAQTEQAAESGEPAGPATATCTWCPVCTVVGVLRGERPELAATLTEHTDGLLTALRMLLQPPDRSPGGGEPAGDGDEHGEDGPQQRRVERIEVRRTGTAGGC